MQTHVGQRGSWDLNQVCGLPYLMLFPLHHAADGGVAYQQPLGFGCCLSSIKEMMHIPAELSPPYLSLPAKYTDNHNPISHQTNTQTHPMGFAVLGEQQPSMLMLLLKTQLSPSMSQLTNGHNFFNASKLFMNEQGGAVVTPKPLWLGRE